MIGSMMVQHIAVVVLIIMENFVKIVIKYFLYQE